MGRGLMGVTAEIQRAQQIFIYAGDQIEVAFIFSVNIFHT